jgi:hypothetical protein
MLELEKLEEGFGRGVWVAMSGQSTVLRGQRAAKIAGWGPWGSELRGGAQAVRVPREWRRSLVKMPANPMVACYLVG